MMRKTSEHSADYTYVMPHTTSEIQRLRNQHDWIKASMGGKLVFAPIEPDQPMHVLDSATADGLYHFPNKDASVQKSYANYF